MEEIAKVLADFNRSLRLEGFTEKEAFQLTVTYLASMASGHAANAAP